MDVQTQPKAEQKSGTEISVVLPCYNEEGNIGALHADLTEVLRSLKLSYEIVYVDDGSKDNTFGVLKTIATKDKSVRVLRLRRNFGQTAGISAGLNHAKGNVVFIMDADRQNDPRDIPRLLDKMREGYDVVSGWRKDRKDPFLTRKLPSWIANSMISTITGVHLHDYGCMLKAYKAEYIRPVRLYGEMHRFIPALVVQQGAKITEMPVTHHPRTVGKSNYGLSRTFKVVLDVLVVKFLSGYASKPIHLFGGLGIVSCGGGILAGALALYEKIANGVYVHRNPLILLAVFLFLIGVQSILMGLVAELLMRTYHESQRKPIYNLAETVNLEE